MPGDGGIEVTLGLPSFGELPGGDWRGLVELARIAEGAGLHRVVVTDHVVNGPNVADYPWGRFPTGPDGDWLEPLTVLAAIAAVTERVRLSTGILIAPLRPAPLLAKTVATLDVLSGGRVDLGVGTGWQPEELRAFGIDPAERGQRLTDTVGACRALWQEMPASYSSPSVSFDDVYCAPQPVQARLPVWFSGTLTSRNVRRIVELGDGWIPIMGSTVDDIAAGVSRLHAEFKVAGRSPDELSVQCALPVMRDDSGAVDWGATAAAIPALQAAGATNVSVHLRALDPSLEDPASACAGLMSAIAGAISRE